MTRIRLQRLLQQRHRSLRVALVHRDASLESEHRRIAGELLRSLLQFLLRLRQLALLQVDAGKHDAPARILGGRFDPLLAYDHRFHEAFGTDVCLAQGNARV